MRKRLPLPGEEQMLDDLRRRLAPWGAAARVAREIGVSHSYMKKVKSGEMPPTDRIAAALGYRRVERWERSK